MLVVFDLDDTLVETTKCLVSFTLKAAFDSMKEGLEIEDEKEKFQELLSIDRTSISSRATLLEFWKRYSNNSKILNLGLEALKENLPENLPLDPVPGALTLLKNLHRDHVLALVTYGNFELQIQKLKKAGIQPELFSKLVVGSGESKKIDYEQVLKELAIEPSEGVVCGDRIPIDLTPAKELGLYTIHFRNGRGLNHSEPKDSVDLTINRLEELNEVFAKYES